MNAGTRVRIHRDREFGPGPWPEEPTGALVLGPDGALFSDLQTPLGLRRQYWVEFDEPQFDADGDGPYVLSQVLDKYIEVIDE